MARWTLSRPLKLGLPCGGLAVAFFLTAFSVHSWVTADFLTWELEGGLWKACYHDKDSDITQCGGWTSQAFHSVKRNWFHKTQALQCLSLVVLVGAVGAWVVFLLTRLKAAVVTAIVTCFMAAFFAILGCALFASDMSSDPLYSAYGRLGWAFGLCIVGAVFLTATGAALIVHVLFFSTTTSNTTNTHTNTPA